MAILGAVQVPHPPLILPEVGHGEEKRSQSTIDAFERAAKFIADLQPDTVIVSLERISRSMEVHEIRKRNRECSE